MIFCFSATGNSLWVAERISLQLDEQIFSINSIAKAGFNAVEYEFTGAERLIIVCPVHGWSVPPLVEVLLSKIHFEGRPSSVYVVLTCGDDCGTTDDYMRSLLAQKGFNMDACLSVTMPNDYVLMRGFSVDSEKVQNEKLISASVVVDKIIRRIRWKVKGNSGFYNPGNFPWTKSHILKPLFRKLKYGGTKFKVTDACVGCTLCSQVCPTNNIRMHDGKPQWRHHCIQCSACFHRCPKNAVQYGSITANKKQYVNPYVEFDD